MRARQDAKSERIRLALGILTPEEKEAERQAEERRRQDAQKKATKGTPLGLEEES